MTKIELVIFDLDGTLIDSAADLVNTMIRLLTEKKLAVPDAQLVKNNIGWGIYEFVKLSAPGLPDRRIKELVTEFRSIYLEHMLDNTRVFPGIPELLDRLAPIKRAVFTNKSEEFSLKLLTSLKIVDKFDVILGRESVIKPKPDPEGIDAILARTGVPRSRTLLIGDSDLDIESGRRAQVATCGVTYGGIRPISALLGAKPDHVAASADEIWRIICDHY